MKNSRILIFSILSIFLLTACGEETKENHTDTIETPKKTYIDNPTNTYDRRVEAQNIANTLQNPVNTYLNSRTDAMSLAKQAVKKSDKRTEEQDEAMEALLGK
jgi:hypothetical protein